MENFLKIYSEILETIVTNCMAVTEAIVPESILEFSQDMFSNGLTEIAPTWNEIVAVLNSVFEKMFI